MNDELNQENFGRRLRQAQEGLTPERRDQLRELAQQAVAEDVFFLTQEMLREMGQQIESPHDLADLCGVVNDIFYAHYGLRGLAAELRHIIADSKTNANVVRHFFAIQILVALDILRT